MASRNHPDLIAEIEQFSTGVSKDAKATINTIRNLIESNSRVEESVDELHKTISNSNLQNERLQKRFYYLTIVTVLLALVQAFAVVVELLKGRL